MTTPPPTHPTTLPDHPLYLFLLAQAGQDDSDRAIVQTAVLHRPFLDDLEMWVCQRCSWCQVPPGATENADMEIPHLPISAYAPCEELRLLAWPYRRRHGYDRDWMPEAVIPTNPPTPIT